jgi:hypothetical protein
MYTEYYNPLHSYHETLLPKDNNSRELLLGLEFECELPNDGSEYEVRYERLQQIAERLQKAFPDIMVKEDGSLACGFEVITKPMTLLQYESVFDWRWLSALRHYGMAITREDGVTVGENAMHVHVNRQYFDNDEQIDKMEDRVLRWYKQWKRAGYFVEPTVYCQAEKKEWREWTDVNGNVLPKVNHDRYRTVNVHRNTVELRSFVPSFDKQHVLDCLQIAHQFAYIAKTTNKETK